MIRVIIADDEARIIKLIINLIDWQKIDMTVVGTASNGMEALKLIQRENPHIVITDIRMPGYDGLDMIERAKKINSNLEFIIISGYGEFEYAKKGIEFGVKDYLIKPINKDQLLKALIKAGECVKKKREQVSLEKEYELILKNDANKIREACLSNLTLFTSEKSKEYTLTILDKDKSHNNRKQIRQAKKYIEENYMKNITLEDLGAHIGFNPSYFSSLFKKETGTSFIEYLSKVRIDKSKSLLRESDLRIQDVCLMVGYNDAKYFTKAFIKHTGLKPNEYRKIFE